MELPERIIRRIFIVAAERIGSLNRLAAQLDVSPEHIYRFIDGSASPIDSVLLGAVDLAIEDLSTISAEFPSWQQIVLKPRLSARQ